MHAKSEINCPWFTFFVLLHLIYIFWCKTQQISKLKSSEHHFYKDKDILKAIYNTHLHA